MEGYAGKEYSKGLIYALTCAAIWGVLPVYWKQLQSVDSMLIMFYRLVMSFVLVLLIGVFRFKKEKLFAPLREKGAKLTFAAAGALISCNWGIYIWAVNHGHIIQTSVGYYMEPLVVCVFGVAFFNEKLDKYKTAAFVLAVGGVLFMLVAYRQLPTIALALAFSFATYAAFKKKVQVHPLQALLYETMFLAPIALAVILYMEFTGRGAFSTAQTGELVWLCFSGLFTAAPLVLFAMAASRIDFITLGITEYIAPSIGLILGVFLYNEPFDMIQLTAFVLIWIGLVIFTYGGLRGSRQGGEGAVQEEPNANETGK